MKSEMLLSHTNVYNDVLKDSDLLQMPYTLSYIDRVDSVLYFIKKVLKTNTRYSVKKCGISAKNNRQYIDNHIQKYFSNFLKA
jgi:hypothetical protein